MASSESYFKTLDAADVTAKQVAVTPAVQPVGGCAHVSKMKSGKASIGWQGSRDCPVIVAGADLVVELPPTVSAGDVVHWTSYGA